MLELKKKQAEDSAPPQSAAKPAGGPPPGVADQVRNPTIGQTSGVEGREEELGRAIAVVLKTMNDSKPYQHEQNDALVKATLTPMQFAKSNGMLEQFVEHDIDNMKPMLGRVRAAIEQSGNKELAMIAMFDRTSCFYQMVDQYDSEPGMRRYKSPYKLVLAMGTRIGQFDLTEQEIHERYTIPRYLGYAKELGVNITVSPWQDDGIITVQMVD